MSEQPKSGDEIRITEVKHYRTIRVGDVLIVADSWVGTFDNIVRISVLIKGHKTLSIIKGNRFEWEIINRFNQ